MAPADLPQALNLSTSANWNQTEEDWRRILHLADCFCTELDGQIVASASAMIYGNRDLAWIGMVLTLPAYRGRGLASTLVQAALDHCSDVYCVKLDATDLGAPVYRKYGFEDECVVERWSRQPSSTSCSTELTDGGEPILDLDRAAFGADRTALLASFPNICSTGDGFAMHRPGRQSAQFGPCVSETEESARLLAGWATARNSSNPLIWDLFESHPKARQLAHELRFTPARRLLRMSLGGKNVAEDPSLIYALTGFEWG
ncbi:acetyltransferase [Bryobacterales bacterium F-183]|nr:acetyltransferase [Bryobacterales bacterium F-183]